MLIEMLYSKIHRATVTDANLNYVGSITIDEELLEASKMRVGQKVEILNINNGERFSTYIILVNEESVIFVLTVLQHVKCIKGIKLSLLPMQPTMIVNSKTINLRLFWSMMRTLSPT
jgi:L-aspartate-alpha-decarboxylase